MIWHKTGYVHSTTRRSKIIYITNSEPSTSTSHKKGSKFRTVRVSIYWWKFTLFKWQMDPYPTAATNLPTCLLIFSWSEENTVTYTSLFASGLLRFGWWITGWAPSQFGLTHYVVVFLSRLPFVWQPQAYGAPWSQIGCNMDGCRWFGTTRIHPFSFFPTRVYPDVVSGNQWDPTVPSRCCYGEDINSAESLSLFSKNE